MDNESLLRSEFEIEGQRKLLAVTGSLSHALALVGKSSKPIEQAEEDLQREAEAWNTLETGRCPKCDVEMQEEGYEGDDGDSAWWLTCPECGHRQFPFLR